MDEQQIRTIRALQSGSLLCEEPFKEIAVEAGVTENDLLDQIRAWKVDGTIRRFGAILRHHQAGYLVNAMCVWNVPDEQVAEFGYDASSLVAVSHCYQRPRFEGFDYNVYTMIHGRSRTQCRSVAHHIILRTGISDHKLLFTTAEFKKSSPVYFAEDAAGDP